MRGKKRMKFDLDNLGNLNIRYIITKAGIFKE